MKISFLGGNRGRLVRRLRPRAAASDAATTPHVVECYKTSGVLNVYCSFQGSIFFDLCVFCPFLFHVSYLKAVLYTKVY